MRTGVFEEPEVYKNNKFLGTREVYEECMEVYGGLEALINHVCLIDKRIKAARSSGRSSEALLETVQ